VITDSILGLLIAAAEVVVGLLPDAEPLGLSGVGGGLLYGYAWLDSFAPVSETLAGAGVYLGALVLTLGVRAVLSAYRLIPGKFT
jgi:hypothetical protein